MAVALAPAPHHGRFRREFVSWVETAGLILLVLVIIMAVLGAPVVHLLRFLVETAIRTLSSPR